MERHFLVPATFAAVLHVLLLGIHRGPAPVVLASPIPAKDSEAIVIVKEEEPPIDRADEAAGGGAALPRQPDAPSTTTARDFTVPVSVDPIGPVTPGIQSIPNVPITIGSGSGEGPMTNRPVIDFTKLDRSPRTRVQIAPTYPPEARQSAREGEVTVAFEVDETGHVFGARAVSSTDRIFDDAAVRAVSKWRFEPGTVSGRAVRFRMAVPIVFRLNGE
jgi:protein TonB